MNWKMAVGKQSQPKSWHSVPGSAQQNSCNAAQQKIHGRTESDDICISSSSYNPACLTGSNMSNNGNHENDDKTKIPNLSFT